MDKRRKYPRIAQDERGATAIEYGMICAMIVLVMLVALKGVAQANTSMWTDVETKVVTASAATR